MADWDLSSISCQGAIGGAEVNLSLRQVNIKIKTGQQVTCTFTNAVQPGTIVIIKYTVPDGPRDFFFLTAGSLTPASFWLDDDADGTLTHTRTITNVATGTYTVTEMSAVGYNSTLGCVDPDNGTTTSDATVNIAIDPDETVSCTFTNQKLASLTVTKVVTNDNGGSLEVSSFPLFVDGASVNSGDTLSLTAGTPTYTETNQSGYVGSYGGDCDANGNVTLAAGDNKSCTLFNDDHPASLAHYQRGQPRRWYRL